MTKNINGDVYSDLITSADSREMNFGDDRESVEFIVIHHNATTNKDVAINTWTVAAGNQTSAHYEVTPDEIIGIVGENHVAWHAGGTGANDVPTIPRINQRSIGIENLNSTGAPDWLIDDKTYANLAALVADICKRYNLPINRSTVKKHNEITKTACPGGIDIDKVIALATGEKAPETSPDKPETPITNDVDYMRQFGYVIWKGAEFTVDDRSKYAGLWQVISNHLSGLQATGYTSDTEWLLNGVPMSAVDWVDGTDQNSIYGTRFKFKQDRMNIVDYDVPSNGIAVNVDGYPVWVDATVARNA